MSYITPLGTYLYKGKGKPKQDPTDVGLAATFSHLKILIAPIISSHYSFCLAMPCCLRL